MGENRDYHIILQRLAPKPRAAEEPSCLAPHASLKPKQEDTEAAGLSLNCHAVQHIAFYF